MCVLTILRLQINTDILEIQRIRFDVLIFAIVANSLCQTNNHNQDKWDTRQYFTRSILLL